MSREEIVFSKRALIVVATISTLGGVASVGWFAHLAITNIERQALAAITDVRQSVHVLQMAQVQHNSMDDQREISVEQKLAMNEDRLLDLERDVSRIVGILGDRLPPERRRKSRP